MLARSAVARIIILKWTRPTVRSSAQDCRSLRQTWIRIKLSRTLCLIREHSWTTAKTFNRRFQAKTHSLILAILLGMRDDGKLLAEVLALITISYQKVSHSIDRGCKQSRAMDRKTIDLVKMWPKENLTCHKFTTLRDLNGANSV